MRRSRIDIVAEILEVAKKGVNKTAIVYKTNLNFTLAEKYLSLLEKQGLLENKSDKYVTSDRGRIFLAKARELTVQLESPNCQEDSIQEGTTLPELVIADRKMIRQIAAQHAVPI